jgi:hypothetical protein
MSDEKEVKEEQLKTPEEAAPQNVSVEQIIGSYPIDRDRVRDTLLVTISTALNRIANALEYFANQDIADRKGKEVSKDQK